MGRGVRAWKRLLGVLSAAMAVSMLAGCPIDLGTANWRYSVGDVVVVPSTCNYSPSVMHDGSVYKLWWCSSPPPPAGDHIFYAEADSLDGPFHAPGSTASYLDVFQPTRLTDPNSPSFDKWDTCDPSVLRVGSTYYLYYGGLPCQNSPNQENSWTCETRIGLATSSDGIHWTRQKSGDPIILPHVTTNGVYGAGQASVSYVNGYFYLAYSDTTGAAGNGEYVLRSTDPAFSPGTVQAATQTGWQAVSPDHYTDYLVTGHSQDDLRYVDSLGAFAMATGYGFPNVAANVSFYSTDFRNQPFQAVTIPGSATEEPALVATPDGHVSSSNNRPGCGSSTIGLDVIVSTTQLVIHPDPTNPMITQLMDDDLRHFGVDITCAQGLPGPTVRYADGTTLDHASLVSGPPTSSSAFDRSFGSLLTTSVSGTHPLWACRAGSDEFTSTASDCENATIVGLLGYAYDSATDAPAGTPVVGVRRCYVTSTGEHFDSLDLSGCEGQTGEGIQGYFVAETPWVRYRDVATNDRASVVSGPPSASSVFDESFGSLLTTSMSDTHPLWRCRAGTDEFTSPASNCENATVVGLFGYAYDSAADAPVGTPVVGVRRCYVTSSGEHFDSLDLSGCEGQTGEGIQGYVVAETPWVRYRDMATSDHASMVSEPPTTSAVFEASFGSLLTTSVAGTHPLWACRAGSDEFTSPASDCENATVVSLLGYAYDSAAAAPPGTPVSAVRRCFVTSTGEHFDSEDVSGCEGQTGEGILGYVTAHS